MAGGGDLGRAQALVAAAFAVVLVVAAGASPARHRLGISVVASGFRQPVQAVAAPGDSRRLYVVERAGRVRVIDRGEVLREPFVDIRPRVRSGGLLGLLSIAFHPRYPRDPRVYAMYTGKAGNVYVVELRLRRGRARITRTLLRLRTSANAYAHVGGQIAFGPGGKLLVGIGDGLEPSAAQDPQSPLGKILRLDADDARPVPGLVALGLRNPWRFSFDRATGDLFVGDVGGESWEEIDVVRRGTHGPVNFGWDAYEGREPRADAESQAPAEHVFPYLQYAHPRHVCAAVIGGFVYRGSAAPSARGRYFYGDTCSGAVWSVPAAAAVPRPRKEPFTVAQLSSFGQGVRGELYLVARGPGAIFRLTESGG